MRSKPYAELSKTVCLTLLVTAMGFSAGCNRYRQPNQGEALASAVTAQSDDEHLHRGAAAVGIIATLGNDEYHAEAMILQNNQLAIYLLAADETRIQEVDEQVLTGYLKTCLSHATQDHEPSCGETAVILLRPDPLPGDSPGMTSRFVGELAARLNEQTQVAQQAMYLTLPGLRIQGERYVARFHFPATMPTDTPMAMPVAVGDDQARELYLTAGGLYSESDIAANGAVTAGEKYRDFRAQHDANPPPGAKICPITQTKANAQCSWIIGGESYEFCCPPCIDEFLEIAKSNPEEIQPADSYRKRE